MLQDGTPWMQPEPLVMVGFANIMHGLPVAGTNEEHAAAPPVVIWEHCVTADTKHGCLALSQSQWILPSDT